MKHLFSVRHSFLSLDGGLKADLWGKTSCFKYEIIFFFAYLIQFIRFMSCMSCMSPGEGFRNTWLKLCVVQCWAGTRLWVYSLKRGALKPKQWAELRSGDTQVIRSGDNSLWVGHPKHHPLFDHWNKCFFTSTVKIDICPVTTQTSRGQSESSILHDHET